MSLFFYFYFSKFFFSEKLHKILERFLGLMPGKSAWHILLRPSFILLAVNFEWEYSIRRHALCGHPKRKKKKKSLGRILLSSKFLPWNTVSNVKDSITYNVTVDWEDERHANIRNTNIFQVPWYVLMETFYFLVSTIILWSLLNFQRVWDICF